MLLNPDPQDAGALFLQQTWGQGYNSCLGSHTQTHTRLLSAEVNFPTMPGVVSLPVTSPSGINGEDLIYAGSGGAEILISPLNTGSVGMDYRRDKLQQVLVPPSPCAFFMVTHFSAPRNHLGLLGVFASLLFT